MKELVPDGRGILLAAASGILLVLAFPDFDLSFLAWIALVPLLIALNREKESAFRALILGWTFGVIFFFGSCWWLTYAPIHYAAFPPLLAYFLLFCVTAVAAIFPGIFGTVLSILLRRFGNWAFLLAPFVWVCTEFLRYWFTGNNWNAIGYSQAFTTSPLFLAKLGGVSLISYALVLFSSLLSFWLARRSRYFVLVAAFALALLFSDLNAAFRFFTPSWGGATGDDLHLRTTPANVVAIQPNVPASGLNESKWNEYRRNHVRLAESGLAADPRSEIRAPQLVVFPESPMNFMYEDDAETRAFINGFSSQNNVNVLFNSAEPDRSSGKFYNSAVMVDPKGNKLVQYDKIYLLPFGEAVPVPFESFVPAFVGSFAYGTEHDLFPVGETKAGVMICFESHFGQLSREYVRNGADVIIEMTNDGYLGQTPVLRQHLANAVFRAVETNRPVLRVTNVGITAYINERGEVLDAAEPYTEATRVWSVARSDGSQTFYVKYGDWFAWLCSIFTVGALAFALIGSRRKTGLVTNN